MMRLPRTLISLGISSALSSPILLGGVARAADAAAPADKPASAVAAALAAARLPAVTVSPQVANAAENFFHYASVARYELARAEGEKLLGMTGAQPLEVLTAFEKVVADRNQRVPADRRVELYERMLSWQRVPDLKDVSAKLIGIFNKGNETRRADAQFIESNIQRLSVNRRAYELAVQSLRQSGELAVPMMIAYLKDPSKSQHHVAIRNALRDLGIKALNPLLAATSMTDWDTLPWVISALGDLGYDNAVPYLVRLAQDKQTPAQIKDAAAQALLRLNVPNPNELNAAQLFVELGEKFYYDKASVAADAGAESAQFWTWTGGTLVRQVVPAPVFNEDMALRCCEYALQLDKNRADALSLWLAAAYKREAELPAGATDPTWDSAKGDTHFFAVASGTQYLNSALARAINDRNAAVALKAIRSLQKIVGNANLFTGGDEQPIIAALRYPDRQVRFEAAFTVAAALPLNVFNGQDRVVPVLAEALGQTGKAGVLVVAPSQDRINAVTQKLAQYTVRGGASADAAVANAAGMSGIDVIVINEEDPQIDRLFVAARENVRLAGSAILIRVTSEAASAYAPLAAQNPLVSVTAANDDGLAAAVEAARKKASGLGIDEKAATDYALRAAALMGNLAINRSQSLDLLVAKPALLAALDDARPELIRAAGAVLAWMDAAEAQAGLLGKALDEKTADDLKIDLLKDAAINAKRFGNRCGEGTIESLKKLIASGESLEVRSAAAEVLGAMNLPADQVKTLILGRAQQQK